MTRFEVIEDTKDWERRVQGRREEGECACDEEYVPIRGVMTRLG